MVDLESDDELSTLFDRLKEKKSANKIVSNAVKKNDAKNASDSVDEEEFSECYHFLLSAKSEFIQNALTSKNVRLLKESCWTAGGLLGDENRIKIWPLLIGATSPEFSSDDLFNRAKECSSYQQIKLDVRRTVSRFSSGLSAETIREFQNSVIELVCAILLRNPNLHYYQGYHDVCLTFMLVHGRECIEMLEKITLSHFEEFMQPTMEQTMLILADLMPLIDALNQKVAEHMYRSGVGVIFAVSWIITWFSHVLDQLPLILRLYDVFICSHRLTPLYIAAEIVSLHSDLILSKECEMSSLHQVLTRLPSSMTMDQLDKAVESASHLLEKYPPDTLSELSASWKKRCDDFESQQEMEMSICEINKKEEHALFTRVLFWGMTIGVGAVATIFMYNHVQKDSSMLLDDFISLLNARKPF